MGQVGKDGDGILANFHLQSIVSALPALQSGFMTHSVARNLVIYRLQLDVFSDLMVLAVCCRSGDQSDLSAAAVRANMVEICQDAGPSSIILHHKEDHRINATLPQTPKCICCIAAVESKSG